MHFSAWVWYRARKKCARQGVHFNSYWRIPWPISGKLIQAIFWGPIQFCSKSDHELDRFLENSSRPIFKYGWVFQGIGLCHNRWVFQDLPIRVKMTVMISNPEISRISKSYLCHSEWDTRIAAAESIEAIIDQVCTILYGLKRSS